MRYTYEQPEYLDKVGVVHLAQQLKIYIDDIATGNIDLSDYVTKAELQAKLDALDINIDLSAYATKEELTNALSNIDLSAYALKAEIPSLEGYATQEYVTDAINNAQLSGDGSSVDLSIYAKKSDLDSKADTEHTHTMSDITDYTAPDLSSYAKKTDIPSLSGYATKTYVDQNKFSGSYNDLTDKPTIPSTDGLATTEYVDNAVANIPSGGGVNLSNYYTKNETYSKEEVDTAIENELYGFNPNFDFSGKTLYFDTTKNLASMLPENQYKLYISDTSSTGYGYGQLIAWNEFSNSPNGRLTLTMSRDGSSYVTNNIILYDINRADGETSQIGTFNNHWATSSYTFSSKIKTPVYGDFGDSKKRSILGEELFNALMSCVTRVVDADGNEVSFKNFDVKTDLSDYQYEPQKYKYNYHNIYGTKLNIDMPQLPTFDGGTVLHITPPDGWSNFINARNDCMTVYVKKDKDREYIDLMNDDIICNVDSEGHATPALTIPNTTAGFLDNYIIRGTQYVPNSGAISLKYKERGWLYDYQKIDNNLSCYTKWTTDFSDFASGIDGFSFIFDTSKRTGSVTFNFGQHDCYVDKPHGGIIRKSRNSSFTVDVTDVDTYSIYVPVGTDDNLHMALPEYTITYPDEIVSGTFKVWTSDIDVVNISTQYEFTVNVKQFTDEQYVRYGNEDLVKSIKPIIPTRASELLNDVPFATETYVNEKVTEISGVDLSNYYTKSETDALIPTVIDGVVNGKDGVTPHIDETTKRWFIGDTDTGILAEGTNGTNGTNGVDGVDGVSPTVTVTKEGKVATITCTDVNGTTTATISDGADGQGGSGGGASGITYAYDTEIATGETYFDGRPIYMKIFHIDALSSAPSNYIVYDNYHSQTPFADTLVSVEPIWKSNSNQKIFNGNVIQPFNSASGSSSSAAISAVNNLLKTVAWVQAWQSSSEFAITVTRGQDMYEYGCDVFVKYVKLA